MKVEYEVLPGNVVLSYYKEYDTLTINTNEEVQEKMLETIAWYIQKAKGSKFKYVSVQFIKPNTVRLYSLMDFLIDIRLGDAYQMKVLVTAHDALQLLYKLIVLENELGLVLYKWIRGVFDNIEEYKKFEKIEESLGTYYMVFKDCLVKIDDVLDILEFDWEMPKWENTKFKPILNKEGRIIGVDIFGVKRMFNATNSLILRVPEDNFEVAELLKKDYERIAPEYKEVVDKYIEEVEGLKKKYNKAKRIAKKLLDKRR